MIRYLLLGCCVWASLGAHAQFRVEVSGVGMTQVPIAVATFRGDDAAPQKIGAIVAADLERSGQFRNIDTGGAVLDEISLPNISLWKQRNADALVTGSVARLADGRFDVRVRLWDVVKNQDLGGQSHAVGAGELRLAAHRIADFVYEKLTGEKGVFSTRIAYVTKGRTYNLWVADADGENAVSALGSPEPIISPAWAPNGVDIAYVSFQSRKPEIWVRDIFSTKPRLLASFKGSNSAPAWSPDGKTLAVTLSKDGSSQLYLLDAKGGSEPRRLIQSNSIDTEPVFTSDGKSIYFVSDRGGSPQIYRMPVAGGNPERVTFTGTYNISPAISPNGRWMAYVSRVGGAFKLHVMDIASGVTTSITETVADESPSFAPNSRLIIYATQQQGHEVLMTTTLDGKIKARLAGQNGDIREPDWGSVQR